MCQGGMYSLGMGFQILWEKWLQGCHRRPSLKWWVEIIHHVRGGMCVVVGGWLLLEMEELHIWDWMCVLVGARRDAVVSSVLLCIQTFTTQLSSPVTDAPTRWTWAEWTSGGPSFWRHIDVTNLRSPAPKRSIFHEKDFSNFKSLSHFVSHLFLSVLPPSSFPTSTFTIQTQYS